MEIGLVIALAAVVGAFAWGQSKREVKAMVDPVAAVEEEVIVNTEQEQRQPEVRPQVNQVISDFIDVVRNETQITTEYDFNEFDEDFIVEVPTTVVEEVADEIPIYTPEEAPIPPGGDINAFRNWVQGRLSYPTIASENGIQGKVVLRFVIERDGSLTGIEQLASPDKSLTDEAMRVLKTSPKWTPGKQRNRPVRVWYILPVDFMLQQ